MVPFWREPSRIKKGKIMFSKLLILLIVNSVWATANENEEIENKNEIELFEDIFGQNLLDLLGVTESSREARHFGGSKRFPDLNDATKSMTTEKLRSLIDVSGGYGGHGNYLSSVVSLENFKHLSPRYFYYSRPLDIPDFWHHRMGLLSDVIKIMKDPGLLADVPFSEKIIEKLYEVLIYVRPNGPYKTSKCPYGYTRTKRGLCLTFDLSESTTWLDAEQYCQEKKGGQLVIIRDANDYYEIRKFLLDCLEDLTLSEWNFWIGASDQETESFYYQLDGSLLKTGPPFWGENQPADDDDDGEDYAMLVGADDLLIYSELDEGVDGVNNIPLCQYIPERDGELFFQTQNTGFTPWITSEGVSYSTGGNSYSGDSGYGWGAK